MIGRLVFVAMLVSVLVGTSGCAKLKSVLHAVSAPSVDLNVDVAQLALMKKGPAVPETPQLLDLVPVASASKEGLGLRVNCTDARCKKLIKHIVTALPPDPASTYRKGVKDLGFDPISGINAFALALTKDGGYLAAVVQDGVVADFARWAAKQREEDSDSADKLFEGYVLGSVTKQELDVLVGDPGPGEEVARLGPTTAVAASVDKKSGSVDCSYIWGHGLLEVRLEPGAAPLLKRCGPELYRLVRKIDMAAKATAVQKPSLILSAYHPESLGKGFVKMWLDDNLRLKVVGEGLPEQAKPVLKVLQLGKAARLLMEGDMLKRVPKRWKEVVRQAWRSLEVESVKGRTTADATVPYKHLEKAVAGD